MRALSIALVLTLGAVAHADGKATTSTRESNIAEGHAAWFDISTSSMAKSKDFYGKLFGWKFTAIPGTDLAVTIVSGTEEIGSLRAADGKVSAFNGVTYIAVNDLPAMCKKATALGGVVPEGFPFNVGNGKGAIAIVADPVGHPIGMYSKASLPETKPPAKPGKK